jgi:MFS transporter, DHA1 family, inner membrane transport protein
VSGLGRWYASMATFAIPQAAAPIAFALMALPLTGDPDSGAAMILAMTLAQIVAAVPLARLGRRFPAVGYLRALVLVRTAFLAALAVLCGIGAPFPLLVVASAGAGLATAAAFGVLRASLNRLIETDRMPRALGISATLGELVFVSAPVLAALLGAVSPVAVAAVIAAVGLLTAVLIPNAPGAADPAPLGRTRLLTPPIVALLFCAAASTAVTAGIEVAAVSLAVRFELEPEAGAIFAVALCVASVLGGVWVSVRNRQAGPRLAVLYFAATAVGAALVASQLSIGTTLVGAVVIGAFLAPIATFFSLTLDRLAPPHRRPEVFALLGTARSIGLIALSGLLAFTTLDVALVSSAVLVAGAVVVAFVLALRGSLAAARGSGAE